VKVKLVTVHSCLLHHEDLRKSESYLYFYVYVIGRNG